MGIMRGNWTSCASDNDKGVICPAQTSADISLPFNVNCKQSWVDGGGITSTHSYNIFLNLI